MSNVIKIIVASVALFNFASVVTARDSMPRHEPSDLFAEEYGPIDAPYMPKPQEEWRANASPFTGADKCSTDRNSANVDGGGGS